MPRRTGPAEENNDGQVCQTVDTPATIHDQKLVRGRGELHQIAEKNTPTPTTAQGGPVSDDQNTLKIGRVWSDAGRGFTLSRENLPLRPRADSERVVHARGYGAHGYFETYESLAKYTRADIFQRAGEKTPVFVRFSTVAGSKGSFDPHLQLLSF
ncbi:hypothetical protein MESS2_1630021 [Mesorhizobium metallidurans STM 2683]|uniref:catalase n=1 Tax=Mesorhizobium metallidurans STM 2683 TaxID=1297569 RepID=M5ELP3_9HYPH|nr:hypothetical protein MESS2_1630021 [Mesorhizobium metallidurans STM 2683]